MKALIHIFGILGALFMILFFIATIQNTNDMLIVLSLVFGILSVVMFIVCASAIKNTK